jgi:hypothetical protein
MRSLSRLSTLVCVVAALGFVAISSLEAGPKKHKEHHKKACGHHAEKDACPMGGPRCEKSGECPGKLGALLEDLKAARKAIEEGKTEKASQTLAKAIERLEQCQKWMQKRHAEAGVPVNTRCPIMGGKVDPEDTPEKLTRRFKGQTVGFCCGACPAKWDELSEKQKEKKLQKVTPDK